MNFNVALKLVVTIFDKYMHLLQMRSLQWLLCSFNADENPMVGKLKIISSLILIVQISLI